jgi:hypothetical protein
MGLTSTELKRLLDCGVTPEALLVVTEIIEERDAAVTERDGDRDGSKSSAERSRLYRKRKRDAAVTATVTERDDFVTHSPTPPLVEERKILKILEQKEGKGSGNARARGTRLPADFAPDKSCETAARERKFTNKDWQNCLDEFRDYWAGVPGTKGLKLDWQATFRNRIRTYTERKTNGKFTNNATEIRDAFTRLEERVAKHNQPDDVGDDFRRKDRVGF